MGSLNLRSLWDGEFEYQSEALVDEFKRIRWCPPCSSPPLSPPLAVIATRFIMRASSSKKSDNCPQRPLVWSRSPTILTADIPCTRMVLTCCTRFPFQLVQAAHHRYRTRVHEAARRTCRTRTVTAATTTNQCCFAQ